MRIVLCSQPAVENAVLYHLFKSPLYLYLAWAHCGSGR